MKIHTGIFLTAIVLFFGACTSTRRVVTEEKQTETPVVVHPPADYTPAQAASHYYLQGVRMSGIYEDYPSAAACFASALDQDSLHAPSYYELSNLHTPLDLTKALGYSLKANEIDPDNIWFKQQLGRLYILTGNYGPARKVYDEIVRLTPNNPDNYRYLAALYDATGYSYAAITLLDSAEVRFGFIEELASYKRELLIQVGMTERAIAETQTLTHNSPYDEQNFIILGDLYTQTAQDSLAVEAYRQALSIDPESTEALMSLSDFYRTRNDGTGFLSVTKQLFSSNSLPLDKKLTFFNDVIKNPQFYQQHYFAVNELVATLAIKYAGNYEVAQLYAEHLINSGDVSGAVATYKSALTDTSGIALYKTIIDIESYLERTDSVTLYADLALERFPGEIELYFTKGYGQYYMKQYDTAIETLSEGLPHAKNDSIKSVLYSSMGEISKAQDSLSGNYVRYFERALKFDPENLHAIYNYSDYLVNAGDNPEKALKNLKNDSLHSMMLSSIGDMYYQRDSISGDRTEAYRYYEKALKFDPDNIHALNNYSYFMSLEDRNLDRALEMSARVMELEPNNPTYIDTYGWILYKLGRYEDAKLALRQAVTFDAGASKELMIHYGDILYELKEYFMASVYWKKALEKGYDPAEVEERLQKIEGK